MQAQQDSSDPAPCMCMILEAIYTGVSWALGRRLPLNTVSSCQSFTCEMRLHTKITCY